MTDLISHHLPTISYSHVLIFNKGNKIKLMFKASNLLLREGFKKHAESVTFSALGEGGGGGAGWWSHFLRLRFILPGRSESHQNFSLK